MSNRSAPTLFETGAVFSAPVFHHPFLQASAPFKLAAQLVLNKSIFGIIVNPAESRGIEYVQIRFVIGDIQFGFFHGR